MTEPIKRFDGEYEFLSNFYTTEVEYQGDKYPSSEHAFQAAKTDCDVERYEIKIASTAGKAKRLGRAATLRKSWESEKIAVMAEVLEDKFSEGSKLADRLLATGDAQLIEGNYWHDNFWGDCTCGRCKSIKGENWLGKLLMKRREELRG